MFDGSARSVESMSRVSRLTPSHIDLGRRRAMFGIAAFSVAGLTGCMRSVDDMANPNIDYYTTASIRPRISVDPGITNPQLMYASMTDGPFVLPAIPYEKIPVEYRRQNVVDPTGEAPGTIVVHLAERHLYYVLPGNEAIRYGVGIGKDGFVWSGRAVIQYKKTWPTWTPPAEMISRKPELEEYRDGMEGGLENPLGARALYIFKDGEDTLFRVHGSPEWWTIGTQASSGCVRMINQDVIDLYDRVPEQTPIVVV
jgi:lipoprotein-anchoring transpeptidase ErfK/SrfK